MSCQTCAQRDMDITKYTKGIIVFDSDYLTVTSSTGPICLINCTVERYMPRNATKLIDL